MSAPTAEQVKQATDHLVRVRNLGFITHLKAAGCDDATIKTIFPRYVKQADTRATKRAGMRTSILVGFKKWQEAQPLAAAA
jgi:hypothetical protein